MRRDFACLLAILLVALGVRVHAPWQAVLGGHSVNFLETDAWYHVRLIENQVRNWPWRVTQDPYAAPGGQFVPIAPLFDTITATVVRLVHGRGATVGQIELAAAFVPPVLGTLTVAGLWGLGYIAFGRRAALVGAALLAILPGHFLDRTQLGFYDHHVLEALLAVTTVWALGVALQSAPGLGASVLAGVSLGLFLLGWSGGAFLVAILGGWLVLLVPVAPSRDIAQAGRVAMVAAVVALGLVVAFQDPRMFRYESQIIGLVALGVIAAVLHVAAARLPSSVASRATAYAAVALVLAVGIGLLWTFSTGVLAELVTDVSRLAADPSRMGVLEARPLFLYGGVWNWTQPWQFFRTGFYIGAAGLVLLTIKVARERRPIDLLIWVTTAAMFVATYGQNRFGYYLVPMCALMGGWLAALALDWGFAAPPSNRSTRRRPSVALGPALAVFAVAGMFATNVVPDTFVGSRPGSLPTHWRDALLWLREHSDPPFSIDVAGGDHYYYARYPRMSPPPDYSVMNWWDHGYWIIQIGRRVPVANPTQERASNAARFYAATSEREALAALAAERSRFVISDWELPFRFTSDGVIMGRFQNVIDWAGARHADYYEVMYQRARAGWVPVWVFFEPYYQSMAYRLSVMGGAAAVPPANSTAVIIVADRVDSRGLRFKEILSQTTYATHDAAVAAARLPVANGRTLVAGLDPWRTAFPLGAVVRLREVHAARTREQRGGEAPWLRIFQVSP